MRMIVFEELAGVIRVATDACAATGTNSRTHIWIDSGHCRSWPHERSSTVTNTSRRRVVLDYIESFQRSLGAAQGRPEDAELSYRSSMGLAQGSYPPPPCAGSRCNAASSDVIRSRASSWACSKVCIIASCSNCRRSFRPLSPAPSGRGRAAAGKARHPGLAPAAPAGGLRQFGIVVLVEELRRLVEVPVARGAGRGLRADRRLLPAHRLRRARRRYPGGGAPPAHGGPPSDRRVRLAHLS